ncbi:FAD:protein FMN transferase [Rhodoferax ferrireducens]|uniref:FAD:protein FMN transferase n=1 Tax=Rhodoferax ferrireducens TaxID=192843 RepID=UPI000E0D71BD|nr:FAD:protein FMN transferase [Rhodoferax ferrireducens]
MKRRVFLQTSLGVAAAHAVGATSRAGAALPWHERTLTGLGTVLSLRVAHAEGARAERALDAAVSTVRHVEAHMSLFDPGSAISRLNRDGVLTSPHPDLVKIFQLAQTVSARSAGAFDVTVQPLWSVFETARRQGTLPSATAVAKARAAVGWQGLEISNDQIRLRRPGMGVTLNGIAQGFAADLVRAQLQAHGMRQALVNTGEWTALGRPEPQRDWLLGIADPRHEQMLLTRLAMDGRSMATSADNECTFSPDRRHHHIFDPHTGYSPSELAGVTVAAPSCALADALTKVMFVAGFHGALRLARAWQVDVLVVDKAGHWQATPGLQLKAA